MLRLIVKKLSSVSQKIDIVKLAKNKIFIFILILSLFLSVLIELYRIDDKLYIYFLDVGQGDATLIRTPDKKFILIDGGPDETVIKELGKYMPMGRSRLDYVFLTHPDADHSAGLISVFKHFKVDNFIYSGMPTDTNTFRQLEQVSIEKSNQWQDIHPLEDMKIGCCVNFDIVWPRAEEKILETNNNSKSFVLIYKDFRAFFGGDLDGEYEDKIATRNPYDLDLLKVGHHGSKYSTSTEFLDRFNPEYAVISAAEGNSYGHPHPETLESLNQDNVRTFITYDFESIYFKTDGFYISYYARKKHDY